MGVLFEYFIDLLEKQQKVKLTLAYRRYVG